MIRRPLIGVNVHLCNELRNRRPDEAAVPEWLCIEAGYLDCLVKAGAECVILPPQTEGVPHILASLAGLVMIGGADYNPERQGYMRTPWNKHLVPDKQEDFDRRLLRSASDLRLPLLAIGAGMQLLNCFCGGSLSYEISQDFPDAMPHQDADGSMVRHTVQLTGEITDGILSHVFRDVARDYDIVTSRHHQAIDEVAPGFVVTLRSRDGIVEGIESLDWLAVGVQFHPESPEADEIERSVFETWLDAARCASYEGRERIAS
jgi:putative glutamine amidotransferase